VKTLSPGRGECGALIFNSFSVDRPTEYRGFSYLSWCSFIPYHNCICTRVPSQVTSQNYLCTLHVNNSGKVLIRTKQVALNAICFSFNPLNRGILILTRKTRNMGQSNCIISSPSVKTYRFIRGFGPWRWYRFNESFNPLKRDISIHTS